MWNLDSRLSAKIAQVCVLWVLCVTTVDLWSCSELKSEKLPSKTLNFLEKTLDNNGKYILWFIKIEYNWYYSRYLLAHNLVENDDLPKHLLKFESKTRLQWCHAADSFSSRLDPSQDLSFFDVVWTKFMQLVAIAQQRIAFLQLQSSCS